jgi:hypothetical protein
MPLSEVGKKLAKLVYKGAEKLNDEDFLSVSGLRIFLAKSVSPHPHPNLDLGGFTEVSD